MPGPFATAVARSVNPATTCPQRFPTGGPNDLLRLFAAPPLQAHRANGFLAAHPLFDLFLRRHLQVGAQFLVQFPMHLLPSKEEPEPTCNFSEQGHNSPVTTPLVFWRLPPLAGPIHAFRY